MDLSPFTQTPSKYTIFYFFKVRFKSRLWEFRKIKTVRQCVKILIYWCKIMLKLNQWLCKAISNYWDSTNQQGSLFSKECEFEKKYILWNLCSYDAPFYSMSQLGIHDILEQDIISRKKPFKQLRRLSKCIVQTTELWVPHTAPWTVNRLNFPQK